MNRIISTAETHKFLLINDDEITANRKTGANKQLIQKIA